MSDSELERRIKYYNEDYEQEFGTSCNHFVCPILFKDEDVEMCRAHIINDALRTSSKWVPQRKDIDNFYGSAIEADFVGGMEHIGRDARELFLDSKSRLNLKPKIEFQGKNVEYFFSKGDAPVVAGQTIVNVTNGAEVTISQFNLKIPTETLLAADRRAITLVIEKDYRPWIVAAVLKAAHLTLFDMMGYHHVRSSTGTLLASILRQFYEDVGGEHAVADQVVKKYFSPHEAMISPLFVKDEGALRGSAEDNLFLVCYTANDVPFILGVIVRVKRHRFCVFLPTDQGIDTYYGFLKNPPQSVRARLARFLPATATTGSAWEIDTEDMRLPLGQVLPENWPASFSE